MPVEIIELLKRILSVLDSINQKMDSIDKKLPQHAINLPPPPRLPQGRLPEPPNFIHLKNDMINEINRVKKLKKIDRENISDFQE